MILTVNISINKEFIPTKWYTIIKNSVNEDKFTTKFKKAIKNLDTKYINNKKSLKRVV